MKHNCLALMIESELFHIIMSTTRLMSLVPTMLAHEKEQSPHKPIDTNILCVKHTHV